MDNKRPSTPDECFMACLDEYAPELVDRYFDPEGPFAADTFDLMGDNDPHRFTRDDLLALNCLDERVPPLTMRKFLTPDIQAKLSQYLLAIAGDTELGRPSSEPDLAAAAALWSYLRSRDFDGIGKVKAGKLLARKRPKLVPIVDSVVEKVVSPVSGPWPYWDAYRQFMSSTQHRARLEQVRPARVADTISLLRVLDVAVWLRGSRSKNAYVLRDEVIGGGPRQADLPWAPRPNG